MSTVAEGDQAKAVALPLRHQSQVQRGVDVVFQNAFAGGEARKIDHGIHFLGMLHAVELHRGIPALGGGLPVNVFKAVAGKVVAQLLELAAPAHLPVGADTQAGSFQEQAGSGVVAHIGIYAKDAIYRFGGARFPQAQGRDRFDIYPAQRVIAAGEAGAVPLQKRGARRQHGIEHRLFRLHTLRHDQAGAHFAFRAGAVLQGQRQCRGNVLGKAQVGGSDNADLLHAMPPCPGVHRRRQQADRKERAAGSRQGRRESRPGQQRQEDRQRYPEQALGRD